MCRFKNVKNPEFFVILRTRNHDSAQLKEHSQNKQHIWDESDLNVGNEGEMSHLAISIEKYQMHTFYKASMASLNSFSHSQQNNEEVLINRAKSVRPSHFAMNTKENLQVRQKSVDGKNGITRVSKLENQSNFVSLRNVSIDNMVPPPALNKPECGVRSSTENKPPEDSNNQQIIDEDSLENMESPKGKESQAPFSPVVQIDQVMLDVSSSTIGIMDANDLDNDGPGLVEKMQQYSSAPNSGYLQRNKSLPVNRFKPSKFKQCQF